MLASHCVIDGFLGAEGSAELLDFALANEANFEPTAVYSSEHGWGVRPKSRTSAHFAGDWKPQRKAFRKVIEERLEEIVEGAGCSGFRPDKMEFEMVATGDGGHFVRHIDTLAKQKLFETDRIVSSVYYFHREPARFKGGELIMHAMAGDQTLAIEPKHDRLVVFSSIAPHEVNLTSVPSGAFEDSRFSINCWLVRKRV